MYKLSCNLMRYRWQTNEEKARNCLIYISYAEIETCIETAARENLISTTV